MPAKGYTTPLRSRFDAKVERTASCWLWRGMTAHGYGYIWNDGKMHRAHRVSYELHVGDVPSGMIVMHSCDVRNCVNPDHLSVGTLQDNARDCVAKGRHGNQWRRQLSGGRRGRAVCDE